MCSAEESEGASVWIRRRVDYKPRLYSANLHLIKPLSKLCRLVSISLLKRMQPRDTLFDDIIHCGYIDLVKMSRSEERHLFQGNIQVFTRQDGCCTRYEDDSLCVVNDHSRALQSIRGL